EILGQVSRAGRQLSEQVDEYGNGCIVLGDGQGHGRPQTDGRLRVFEEFADRRQRGPDLAEGLSGSSPFDCVLVGQGRQQDLVRLPSRWGQGGQRGPDLFIHILIFGEGEKGQRGGGRALRFRDGQHPNGSGGGRGAGFLAADAPQNVLRPPDHLEVGT